MGNPGQPTIRQGSDGEAVRQLQRGLHRLPDQGMVVDGTFGPHTHAAVISFQQANPPLAVDGVVGPATWMALPDGGPMPELREGSTGYASTGYVVKDLQTVLTNGADEWGGITPQGVDGSFGPHTRAAVEAFQAWAHVTVDGVVGDQTWGASLHAMSATLESAVGLQHVLN